MRKIDKDTYLQALGLWHLATNHYAKCQEFEKALIELLGEKEWGHLSDSVYGEREFHEALRLSGIEYSASDNHGTTP